MIWRISAWQLWHPNQSFRVLYFPKVSPKIALHLPIIVLIMISIHKWLVHTVDYGKSETSIKKIELRRAHSRSNALRIATVDDKIRVQRFKHLYAYRFALAIAFRLCRNHCIVALHLRSENMCAYIYNMHIFEMEGLVQTLRPFFRNPRRKEARREAEIRAVEDMRSVICEVWPYYYRIVSMSYRCDVFGDVIDRF